MSPKTHESEDSERKRYSDTYLHHYTNIFRSFKFQICLHWRISKCLRHCVAIYICFRSPVNCNRHHFSRLFEFFIFATTKKKTASILQRTTIWTSITSTPMTRTIPRITPPPKALPARTNRTVGPLLDQLQVQIQVQNQIIRIGNYRNLTHTVKWQNTSAQHRFTSSIFKTHWNVKCKSYFESFSDSD